MFDNHLRYIENLDDLKLRSAQMLFPNIKIQLQIGLEITSFFKYSCLIIVSNTMKIVIIYVLAYVTKVNHIIW